MFSHPVFHLLWHFVAAVGAFPGGQLVGLDNDGVTAATFDLSLGKQTSLRLVIFAAVGAFDYKFGHIYASIMLFIIFFEPLQKNLCFL